MSADGEIEVADELARRAAQLVFDGKVATVAEAVAAVVGQGNDACRKRITSGQVRRHIEAMSMARFGAAGHWRRRQEVLAVAEELMTLLTVTIDPPLLLLVGRAAAGHLDGDVTLHVRVYTTRSIGAIAAIVVDAGHEEPEFSTASTRHGRLDRLSFRDGAVSVVLTRCVPSMATSAAVDLHTGKPIATLDLTSLRQRLSAQ